MEAEAEAEVRTVAVTASVAVAAAEAEAVESRPFLEGEGEEGCSSVILRNFRSGLRLKTEVRKSEREGEKWKSIPNVFDDGSAEYLAVLRSSFSSWFAEHS